MNHEHPFRGLALVALAVLGCSLSNCSSLTQWTEEKQKPGTGDLSFRLTWQGSADLDLYVKNPQGDRIDFVNPRGPQGGVLDIDCNSEPLNPCAEPVENIYWPRRRAQGGSYEYWIVVARSDGLNPSDTFRVEVRVKKKVVEVFDGTILELDPGRRSNLFFYTKGLK